MVLANANSSTFPNTVRPSLSYRFDGTTGDLSLTPSDPNFFQNPYPTYAALHAQSGEAGPIVHWDAYGHWVFGGSNTVNALFRDRRLGRQITHLVDRDTLGWPPMPDHLSDFYALEATSLLELEPPSHTRLRGLINRAFISRNIASLRPSIAATANALLDDLQSGEPVDLIAQFCEPLAVTTIAAMLGIGVEEGPRLLKWSHAMVRMYQAERKPEDELQANRAAKEFAQWVEALVIERRDAPGDDLLSQLIEARDSGDRLSNEEIVSTTILLLNAGHEATVHALGHALHQLLVAPSDTTKAWLQDSAPFVEEVLRYRPPLHMFTRYVLEDCELFGRPFKPGDVVGLHIGMANHDPSVMPNPQLFDPSRKPIRNVAFGAGIHFCIGHTLARLEMETVLPMVMERWPQITLAEQPCIKDAYHFHGLERLIVNLEVGQ